MSNHPRHASSIAETITPPTSILDELHQFMDRRGETGSSLVAEHIRTHIVNERFESVGHLDQDSLDRLDTDLCDIADAAKGARVELRRLRGLPAREEESADVLRARLADAAQEKARSDALWGATCAELTGAKEDAARWKAERDALAKVDHQGAPSETTEAQHKALVLFAIRAARALGLNEKASPQQILDHLTAHERERDHLQHQVKDLLRSPGFAR
jgi:hypothetical protein